MYRKMFITRPIVSLVFILRELFWLNLLKSVSYIIKKNVKNSDKNIDSESSRERHHVDEYTPRKQNCMRFIDRCSTSNFEPR
jgi:hypothetical protein